MDVNPVVSAVRVCPNRGVPVMVTVPAKTADMVENVAVGLAGESRWVAVSVNRWVKVYAVAGFNPEKMGEDWYVPPLTLYSQPATVFNVMLLVVLLAIVGAVGAACVAFPTVAVAAEVMLPVQFAAETVTEMVAPMSACTNV